MRTKDKSETLPLRAAEWSGARREGARSSAEEHYGDIVGVVGSIPTAPTIFRRMSAAAAPVFDAGSAAYDGAWAGEVGAGLLAPAGYGTHRSAGKLALTVVPDPKTLSILSEPPCRSTRDFVMARPRPVPRWS